MGGGDVGVAPVAAAAARAARRELGTAGVCDSGVIAEPAPSVGVRRDRSRGTRARVGQLAEQIRERIIDGRIGHGQASSWAGGTGVPGGRPLFFSTSSAC